MIEVETNTTSENPYNQGADINNMIVPQNSVAQSQKTGEMISDNGQILYTVILDLNTVKQRVDDIEIKQKESEKFFKESASLTKTTRIAILILMLVPIFQLITCAVVVYYSGCDDKLSGLLKWIISSVSIFSIVEMIVGGIKLYMLDKQIENLNGRLDKIDKG